MEDEEHINTEIVVLFYFLLSYLIVRVALLPLPTFFMEKGRRKNNKYWMIITEKVKSSRNLLRSIPKKVNLARMYRGIV